MTIRDTLIGMPRAISVRLDDEALRALQVLEASGLTQSAAIRSSLVAAAAKMRSASSLAAEAAALREDEDDRREMQALAAFMETLRAPG